MSTPICRTCGTPIETENHLRGLCPICLFTTTVHGTSVASIETSNGSARALNAPKIRDLASNFPHLELLELIGVGGMSCVYRATQISLDRTVALKIIRDDPSDQATLLDGFAIESIAGETSPSQYCQRL